MELQILKIKNLANFKLVKFLFIFSLLLLSIPHTVEVTSQIDFTGDATRIQAFIDVEANVSKKDSSSYRFARSSLAMNNRLQLFQGTAGGTSQDFGRVGSSKLDPADLVDLPDPIYERKFSQRSSSLNVNYTFSPGRNATEEAIHLILFEAVTDNSGIDSNISLGFSNSSTGTIYTTPTLYSEKLRSTQKYTYFHIEGYGRDSTSTSNQYYLRSINITNFLYSELHIYEGNDLFLDQSNYDIGFGGMKYDASDGLGGNITSEDSRSANIARTILRLPGRIFAPNDFGYAEMGGFRDLDESMRQALKVASDERYNLTDFKIRLVIPNELTQLIRSEFMSTIQELGDNTQGWQTAANRIRENLLRTIGFARFDKITLDGQFNPNQVFDSSDGGASEDYGEEENAGDDFVDYALAVIGASTEGSSTPPSDNDPDNTATTPTRTVPDDVPIPGGEIDLDIDVQQGLEDAANGETDCWTDPYSICRNPPKDNDETGGIDVNEEDGDLWYTGHEGIFAFFSNIGNWFSENSSKIIIVVIVAIASVFIIYMMRRRKRGMMTESSF